MNAAELAAKMVGAEPLTGIVAMKDWDDGKQRWIGTVCQAFRYPDGTEGIVVYDVGSAETQVEIDDWARHSIKTRPWEVPASGQLPKD